MFFFEELDEITRHWMLLEFLAEENSGKPYRSPRLSQYGLEAFPREMEKALREGNEESLFMALADAVYWKQFEYVHRSGRTYQKKINPEEAARVLAYSEFNTWYVRGFSRRLIEEGETHCEVYRAAPAWQPRIECLSHEGRIFEVQLIYNGHRAKYWPYPGNPHAFSIPVGPNCHHSIRRVRK